MKIDEALKVPRGRQELTFIVSDRHRKQELTFIVSDPQMTKEAGAMAWDEDTPRRKPRERVLGADLSTFSVEELNEYLAELAGERERVEAAIAKKRASAQSAHSVFKI